MSSQHTPGPWTWRGYHSGLDGSDGEEVLTHFDYEGMSLADRNLDANARLIAAAPDLLVALKALLEFQEHLYMSSAQGPIDAAKAAIAKAEGRT